MSMNSAATWLDAILQAPGRENQIQVLQQCMKEAARGERNRAEGILQDALRKIGE